MPELAELRAAHRRSDRRRRSIRKADDPLHVVRSGAADIAVLKVAPLGGVATMLDIARQIDIPVVVSSALDSAVGSAGVCWPQARCPSFGTPVGWAPADCSSKTSPNR